MNNQKLSPREKLKKQIFIAALFVAFLTPAAWLHSFRFPSDYIIMSKISSKLNNSQGFLIGDIIKEGDVICFLQSYARASVLRKYLTDNGFNYLNKRIDGDDDHVWWLIVIKDRNVDRLYRMNGAVRPNIRSEEGACTPITKTLIVRNSDYSFLFDIKTKE